jgi:hypothetical protein
MARKRAEAPQKKKKTEKEQKNTTVLFHIQLFSLLRRPDTIILQTPV